MSDIELVNNPIQKICCESCGKPNLCYQVYAPKEPVKHVINFVCAFCKSTSSLIEIHGLMKLGPISKDDSRYYTIMEDCEENNGVTTWMMKAPYANQ
jgi:hypothetical protein